MYRLELYDATSAFAVHTTFFSPDIQVRRWSKRINAAGSLTFTIDKYHAKATADNLKHWRRVRLFRQKRDGTGFEAVWFGYIERTKELNDRKQIEVLCKGMLEFFKKRYSGANENFNGQGSTEAFGLLSDTNSSDGDTGISSGTGRVTSTKDLTVDHGDVLRTWEDLARAHSAEFEISDAGALNFVSSLGTDRSGSVELVFRRDGEPGSNVDEIEIGEDGRPMANKVIGTSTNGSLTSTKTDSTSQTAYGVLIERKQFNEANDQDTLDSMTQSYLDQVKNPITDFRVAPTMAQRTFNSITGSVSVVGLDVSNVSVGDLVTATIVTANRSTSQTKRVAELIVNVDQNGNEQMEYTLSEAGVFITALFLDASAIDDLEHRLKEVEAEL